MVPARISVPDVCAIPCLYYIRPLARLLRDAPRTLGVFFKGNRYCDSRWRGILLEVPVSVTLTFDEHAAESSTFPVGRLKASYDDLELCTARVSCTTQVEWTCAAIHPAQMDFHAMVVQQSLLSRMVQAGVHSCTVAD